MYDEKTQHTVKPELVTFQTDFNVTFGLGICFDLYFDLPLRQLIKSGVSNFVFPTMWYSGLPYSSGEPVNCQKFHDKRGAHKHFSVYEKYIAMRLSNLEWT